MPLVARGSAAAIAVAHAPLGHQDVATRDVDFAVEEPGGALGLCKYIYIALNEPGGHSAR